MSEESKPATAPSDRNPDPILPTRLKAGSRGLGEASQTEIDSRATDLAISDGRDLVTDADLAMAAEELAGGTAAPTAPEVTFALDQVTTWDDAPEQTGHRVERTPLDDEVSIADRLIAEGLQEADHDIRVSAAHDEATENR